MADYVCPACKNEATAWQIEEYGITCVECYQAEMKPTRDKDKLSPAEAIYAFMAWLTTRKKEVILSGYHDTVPGMEAVQTFCAVQGLGSPKEGWERIIKPMPEKLEFEDG